MIKKTILVAALLLMPVFTAEVKAISPDDYKKFQFEVEHSGDAEVRKAAEILIKKGVIKPDSRSARPGMNDSNGNLSDCHVSFNQRFLSNVLEQDQISKKLPEGLLEQKTVLGESSIGITGRLDGPAFMNPRFAATLDVGFIAANSFKVRISEIKVAGFNTSLFTRMISDYIADAVKRAFPKSCAVKIQPKSGGIIDLDVKVDPEGFVPGISSLGFLSDAGIRNGKLFFCFSIPQKSRR